MTIQYSFGSKCCIDHRDDLMLLGSFACYPCLFRKDPVDNDVNDKLLNTIVVG